MRRAATRDEDRRPVMEVAFADDTEWTLAGLGRSSERRRQSSQAFNRSKPETRSVSALEGELGPEMGCEYTHGARCGSAHAPCLRRGHEGTNSITLSLVAIDSSTRLTSS